MAAKAKNNGRERNPQGEPKLVNVHDFIDPKLRRAVPYGVYDINANAGWVHVGTDHDTASFAVNAIRRWWSTMGGKRHAKAKRLMITADGDGSNGYRVRLWKDRGDSRQRRMCLSPNHQPRHVDSSWVEQQCSHRCSAWNSTRHTC
jgi:DDE family transposase